MTGLNRKGWSVKLLYWGHTHREPSLWTRDVGEQQTSGWTSPREEGPRSTEGGGM